MFRTRKEVLMLTYLILVDISYVGVFLPFDVGGQFACINFEAALVGEA